jgi:hypothetical protein
LQTLLLSQASVATNSANVYESRVGWRKECSMLSAHERSLRDAIAMPALIAAKAVIVLIGLAFFTAPAGACGLWLCAPSEYPPIHAPAQDQRIGPIWTSNGWSYPGFYGDTAPMLTEACGHGVPGLQCRRAPPLRWREPPGPLK